MNLHLQNLDSVMGWRERVDLGPYLVSHEAAWPRIPQSIPTDGPAIFGHALDASKAESNRLPQCDAATLDLACDPEIMSLDLGVSIELGAVYHDRAEAPRHGVDKMPIAPARDCRSAAPRPDWRSRIGDAVGTLVDEMERQSTLGKMVFDMVERNTGLIWPGAGWSRSTLTQSACQFRKKLHMGDFWLTTHAVEGGGGPCYAMDAELLRKLQVKIEAASKDDARWVRALSTLARERRERHESEAAESARAADPVMPADGKRDVRIATPAPCEPVELRSPAVVAQPLQAAAIDDVVRELENQMRCATRVGELTFAIVQRRGAIRAGGGWSQHMLTRRACAFRRCVGASWLKMNSVKSGGDGSYFIEEPLLHELQLAIKDAAQAKAEWERVLSTRVEKRDRMNAAENGAAVRPAIANAAKRKRTVLSSVAGKRGKN